MKNKWKNLSEAEKLIVAASAPVVAKMLWRVVTIFLGIGLIVLAFII